MNPRVELHVGMSGSGKTRELREQIDEAEDDGERLVVIDTTGEIAEAFAEDERRHTLAKVSALPALLREYDSPIVIVPERDRELGPPRRDEVPLVERVAYACLDARDVTIAITEVHMHIPESAPMGRQVRTLLTQYRHYDCALLADTQRFAAVAKPLVSQASALRLFAMAGKRDLDVVSDIGGEALAAAVREAARRLAAHEPGWHVTIDARHPPVRPKLTRRNLP